MINFSSWFWQALGSLATDGLQIPAVTLTDRHQFFGNKRACISYSKIICCSRLSTDYSIMDDAMRVIEGMLNER